ncbi:indole-3-glycerol-phosphate synthase TrpC [Methanobrevibacter sp. 87.7]|uniref:indole-3-glycerol-phosphate synthase n=1 Tax=Methanobrevibacter sp. 87.7 TaxID=387957 RepID=UPI000B5130DB|nr:indole-3-glycerol-phosphate synthase [Methanobrevibacter sp. 87.7]OWT32810.1 indole-3-glycerol-phosphate synthase TrpC [Methanobrevibacter sp. 87.7]
MDKIGQILENKKKLISEAKSKKPLKEIKKEAEDFISTKEKKFRFKEKFKNTKGTKLIAEFKPASPSKGDIGSVKVEDIINIYDKSPVDMISCLTEELYFKSNLNNLKKAVENTNKPILRKDFFIDEYMIYEAALTGASCILLISNIGIDIEKYRNIALDLGLDSVIECHSKEEIEYANDINGEIIGINNRNLADFTIDFNTTKELGQYVNNYLISESGVETIEDAKLLKSYGADALLIGTSLLRGKNPNETKEYINNLNKVLKP